jgi:hypothetical protein
VIPNCDVGDYSDVKRSASSVDVETALYDPSWASRLGIAVGGHTFHDWLVVDPNVPASRLSRLVVVP